jgi:hypothetical protein
LVTLLVLPHKDNDDAFNHWLAYTPEGYYDGSSAVEELIRWQMGGEFLPGQSFAEQFRQPDRIRQILR